MAHRGRVSLGFDPDQRIVHIRYYGDIDSSEIVAEIKAAFADVEKPWTYDYVIDMRRYEGVTGLGDLSAFAQYWSQLGGPADKGHHTAVITPHPLIRARLPAVRAFFPKDVIEVFETLDEGLEWILAARPALEARCA